MVPASLAALVASAVLLVLSFEDLTWAAPAAIVAAAAAAAFGLAGARERRNRTVVPLPSPAVDGGVPSRSAPLSRDAWDDPAPQTPDASVFSGPAAATDDAPAATPAAEPATRPARKRPTKADKRRMREVLEPVSGLGPKKIEVLVTEFGTLEALRDADLDQLVALKGFGASLAGATLAAVND